MSRKERSESKATAGRRSSGRPLRENFLIFCEGETELGYFNAFRKRAKVIKGGNALQRVENAIAYKNKKKAEKNIQHYWIVFDKDDATDEEFVQAIRLAKKNYIGVAWSNQAFELWIILHYRDFSHGCHRNKYEAHVKEFIKWYDKNEKGAPQGRRLYDETHPNITVAIANARKIFDAESGVVPLSEKHSSTKVYELVEMLEKERL